jgi:hypothetical protein
MNTRYLRLLKDRLIAIQADTVGPQPTTLEVTIEMLDQLIQTQDRLIWLESTHLERNAAHETTP